MWTGRNDDVRARVGVVVGVIASDAMRRCECERFDLNVGTAFKLPMRMMREKLDGWILSCRLWSVVRTRECCYKEL